MHFCVHCSHAANEIIHHHTINNFNTIIIRGMRKISFLWLFIIIVVIALPAKAQDMNILVKHSRIKGNTSNLDYGTMVFHPRNATIVDSEGSHNFTSYDCPNMNVTDNGSTVNVAWGGDNVVLKETRNNSDTYIATGDTSRGRVTIKAFRSSSSGKIYLVTVTMPNPSPDVQHITMNFKP